MSLNKLSEVLFFLCMCICCGIWWLFSVCHSGCRSQWKCMFNWKSGDQIPLCSIQPSQLLPQKLSESTLSYETLVLTVMLSFHVHVYTIYINIVACKVTYQYVVHNNNHFWSWKSLQMYFGRINTVISSLKSVYIIQR